MATTKDFILYDSSTGEIIQVGSAEPDKHAAQPLVGQSILSWLEGDTWDIYSLGIDNKLIVSNDVADRPANTIVLNKTTFTADGVDYIELQNIEEGATVDISGELSGSYVVDSSAEFKFTTNIVGEYRIIVNQFPKIAFNEVVNAS